MKDLDYTYAPRNVFSAPAGSPIPMNHCPRAFPPARKDHDAAADPFSLKPQKEFRPYSASTMKRSSLPCSPSTRKLFLLYVPQGNTMFSLSNRRKSSQRQTSTTNEKSSSPETHACTGVCGKLPDRIERGQSGAAASLKVRPSVSITQALLQGNPRFFWTTPQLWICTKEKSPRKISCRTPTQNLHRHDPPPHRANICSRVYAIRDKQCEGAR